MLPTEAVRRDAPRAFPGIPCGSLNKQCKEKTYGY